MKTIGDKLKRCGDGCRITDYEKIMPKRVITENNIVAIPVCILNHIYNMYRSLKKSLKKFETYLSNTSYFLTEKVSF